MSVFRYWFDSFGGATDGAVASGACGAVPALKSASDVVGSFLIKAMICQMSLSVAASTKRPPKKSGVVAKTEGGKARGEGNKRSPRGEGEQESRRMDGLLVGAAPETPLVPDSSPHSRAREDAELTGIADPRQPIMLLILHHLAS